jgi:hypothetical protein
VRLGLVLDAIEISGAAGKAVAADVPELVKGGGLKTLCESFAGSNPAVSTLSFSCLHHQFGHCRCVL